MNPTPKMEVDIEPNRPPAVLQSLTVLSRRFWRRMRSMLLADVV